MVLKPTAFVPSAVQLDKFPLVGVPRSGVTNVGDVANTATPVPVSSVKAPSKLADENEPKDVASPTDVTAPVRFPAPAGAVDAQVVPLEVNTLPVVPGATNVTLDVPLPISTLLAVRVESPVPPAPTGIALRASTTLVPLL